MANNSYTTTIELDEPAERVFHSICQVQDWWSNDFEGNSTKPGDEFTIHHPNQHYCRQKLTAFIPFEKIEWLVTESKLHWLKNNQQEWTNTRMEFQISSGNGKTLLCFTHHGLTPDKECYKMCETGWDIVIKDWLAHFVRTGNPSPEMARAAEIRNQHFRNIN
jgi:hypothetical protein